MNNTLPTTSGAGSKPGPLPQWMKTLRDAVDAEITDDDMQGIVRAFVDKAKKGDEKAAKFVIEYLMGGKFVPQSVAVTNNYYGNDDSSPIPPGRALALTPPSARDKIFTYLDAAGPTKPALIAAELNLPLKSVTEMLNHEWFKASPCGYDIARVNGNGAAMKTAT